jgi:hypothetical protein
MGANPREMVPTPVNLEAAADGRVAGTLNFEIMIRISHFVDVERTNLLRFGHSTELLSAARMRNVNAGFWHARRDQKVAGPVANWPRNAID